MLFSPSHFSFSHILSILIYICIFKISLATGGPSPPLPITRLIHHHSVYSPYFDPEKTTKDLADIDLKNSMSRASYLAANSSNLVHLTDIESTLTPTQGHGFLVHLQIGQKLVDQYVYMDTGSSLLWVNCEPCGLNVPVPVCDPIESSSYEKENCMSSRICSATGAVQIRCDDHYNRCNYLIQYGSNHYSRGHLAKETFKFGSSLEALKGIVFGCAKHTNLYTNGVLGLGFNHLSLVKQWNASKFSYCIGNISEKSYPYNTLVVGDQIKLTGYQTPLIIEDKYYPTLEGITIGDVSLDIDREIFRRRSSDYTGGMVVDSGSTYTFMPQSVLKKFEKEVIKVIDFLLVRNNSIYQDQYNRLCYNGLIDRDLKGFQLRNFNFRAMQLWS